MYSDRLLDHFQHPRYAGELPPPAEMVDVSNPACGDILRLWYRWQDGRIADVGYKVRGCTAAIACGSALAELLIGKTAGELAGLTAATVEDAVGGLPPASKHAAALCLDGLKALRQRAAGR